MDNLILNGFQSNARTEVDKAQSVPKRSFRLIVGEFPNRRLT